MIIAVIDTETTGLDPESASIVEFASVMVPSFESFAAIVKPRHKIELAAMAAHHLRDEDVVDGAESDEVLAASQIMEADFIAAHNAAFDSKFLKIDKPWICTYRCARQLYPDAPGHSNQVLRYYLELELVKREAGRGIMLLPPHRALPDAWVTAHILEIMLKDQTPQQLVELSSKPILIKNCGFGKHRGAAWADIPKDYLRWLIRQDFDADTIHTAKHHLGMV